MASLQGFDQLAEALQQLGWCCSTATIESNASSSPNDCWLRRWLAGPQHGLRLNADGHRQFQQLVKVGWSLRSAWPRSWDATVAEWLGCRFFFGHVSAFSNQSRFHSLVSSRIGRDGSHYQPWPQWIDGALRHVQRIGGRLLVAADTTLAAAVTQFATTAQLPATYVTWQDAGDVTAWLRSMVARPCDTDQFSAAGSQLYLSPALEAPGETFARFPLQDRLAMALADRVFVMTIRQRGAVDKLAQLRLADPAFPTGTLFVTLSRATPQSPSGVSATAAELPAASTQWLKRGAVGWIVVDHVGGQTGPLQHCRLPHAAQPNLQQLTAPLPAHWSEMSADEDWPYVVHCTRGTSGRRLDESQECFRQRVWSQGEARVWHPLETLAHICREGRLRSAAGMTRTAESCVSFSAVPIVPLLRRRIFRAHLSRWDWEPYGLLIRRTSLQRLGAREVVYGTEADFHHLSDYDKPLFQPNWRKQAQEAWRDEREWRALGDVNLHSLPPESIRVFVRTQREAQHFARHSPWPVLWVK